MAVTPAIPRVLRRLQGLRALVIGDAMLDTYLRGATDRLCPEAPVPIVNVTSRADRPGGAANTAVNLRALGADVTLLGVIGADAEGIALRNALMTEGIAPNALTVSKRRRTLAKQRVFAGSQLLVRFDQGSTEPLDADADLAIVQKIPSLLREADAVVISDYGYGVVTPRVIAALADARRSAPRVLVVDAKDLPAYQAASPTAVKPNYREAARLLGLDRDAHAPKSRTPTAGHETRDPRGDERARAIEPHGRDLLARTGARIVAVTLDTEGAIFFERGREPFRTFAKPAEHARAAGAGDTFGAALSLALAAGADLPTAAEIASAAAAIVVAKDGTATASLAEVAARIEGVDKLAASAADLAPHLEAYRRKGARVVLTSGCFDILHRGHVTYLSAAKALGDVLIVGLNTDAGVRRLKGDCRPINPLPDRAAVLAGLSCVDRVVAFDEDTPEALVTAVRPHIFVKGGDYTRASLPEARAVEAAGGEVRILPFIDDRSTTSLIARIRAAPPHETAHQEPTA
ncbi:MAG: D-glycero-beta-D-manno-heptose 1-phosphate adenylyltransferase [Polyangiaceae bacterium]